MEGSLHGTRGLEPYKTLPSFFRGIRTALIRNKPAYKNRVVDKITIMCPAQSGIIDNQNLYANDSEQKLLNLRTKLKSAYENYFSMTTGEVMICFMFVVWAREESSDDSRA